MRRTLRRVAAGGTYSEVALADVGNRTSAGSRIARRRAEGLSSHIEVDASKVVVDASIVSKWLLPEPYADAARRLSTGRYQVIVPDLMFSELGTILQSRVTAGEIRADEALEILHVIGKMPLQIHRTWSLAASAMEIERRVKRAVYHCIYLALAAREGAVLITADRQFYNSVRYKSTGARVCWIEDVV